MDPTPRLKRIMQLASDEAHRVGAPTVGTEHVLLAIIRDNRGTAAAVLQQAGLDVEKARGLLVKMTGAAEPPEGGWPEGPPLQHESPQAQASHQPESQQPRPEQPRQPSRPMQQPQRPPFQQGQGPHQPPHDRRPG